MLVAVDASVRSIFSRNQLFFLPLLVIACLFLPVPSSSALATELTIAWDPSGTGNVAGYKLYYGNATRNYHSAVNAGANTSVTLSQLKPGLVYFFAATAYDSAGNESDFSEEIACNIDYPSDSDDLPDEWERRYFADITRDGLGDYDNDGLSDLHEYLHGTDPTKQDTDGDGMPDGWEALYGLNLLANDANEDLDKDGYSNLQEYLAGTKPDNMDSKPSGQTIGPDFNSNSLTDLGVWRQRSGQFFGKDRQSGTTFIKQWGTSGDVPLTGDFDGDGITDVCVWRPKTGTWYILRSSYQYSQAEAMSVKWGSSGDMPVPGDYDGDGVTDLAVWRPSSGKWYVTSIDGTLLVQLQFGQAGDYPVPGDYDGDGATDLAVWRPSLGRWFIAGVYGNSLTAPSWGTQGDVPLPADYDGDGITDLGIWRPSNGTWYVHDAYQTKTIAIVRWGAEGDVPVAGDYDGDHKADIGVWRPETGRWFVAFAGTGFTIKSSEAWGSYGDLPVSASPSSTAQIYFSITGYYNVNGP